MNKFHFIFLLAMLALLCGWSVSCSEDDDADSAQDQSDDPGSGPGQAQDDDDNDDNDNDNDNNDDSPSDDDDDDDDNDDNDDDNDNNDDDDNDNDDNDDNDTSPIAYEYTIKVDNLPMADVTNRLDLFVEHGLSMMLNVRPWDITPDLLTLLAAARDAGVPVIIWPLLDWNDGSWGCEDTLDAFIENALLVADYIQPQAEAIHQFAINMELGHPEIDELYEYFANGDWAAAIQLLLDNRDQARFAASLAKVEYLIEELAARGFSAMVSTYPFILDDLIDGDPDIQDIADIPMSGAEWARWAFNPYTTEYGANLGLPLGADMVYEYAHDAIERFGTDVEITVGIVSADPDVGYGSIEAFAADIAAAKAGGARRIGVYNLPGLLSMDDPEAWIAALETPPATPPAEPLVGLLRSGVRFVDRLLDAVP